MEHQLRLDALTRGDCELIRQWRNTDKMRAAWRTPYVLTEEMQGRFYDEVVCDRNAPHRYWAVRPTLPPCASDPLCPELVAMAGLSNIQWENGIAEISMLVEPARSGQGIGSAAVELVLREAFERMRLLTVTGEVYACNDASTFWLQQISRWRGGDSVWIPRRKWWNGDLHGAWFFWFTAEGFLEEKAA